MATDIGSCTIDARIWVREKGKKGVKLQSSTERKEKRIFGLTKLILTL